MTKYQLFKKLPLFAYVNKIHVRYNPGGPNTETCRKLMLMLLDPKTFTKHPYLTFTYELLSFNERPEVFLTLVPQVPFRFHADTCTLDDIHRAIDADQYKAHCDYLKRRSIESKYVQEE
ncbi:hypothetical protein BdWA1_001852 [Babesia duncani]|uniref:Uncharacterized protein n=1 Tax=Babesia duncani TaxID=323732 RepID=A0AAD9PKP6_9APIC|nr:hypothetical protein BdWA1_001852 [Babesia duncani]